MNNNDMIGKVFETRSSGKLKVIGYNGSRNVSVEFLDTGYTTTTRASHIRNGAVKDKTSPIVCGVGFFGVGNYESRIGRKKTLAYQTWSNMLRRCYDNDHQVNNPTYKDCSVCEEWHDFQKFAEWFEKHHVNGYQNDKDLLLYGNKIYSPDNCVFVPVWLNAFTTDCRAARGEWPIGVYIDKKSNLFRSSCNDNNGKVIYLGTFLASKDAHNAWLSYKLTLAFTRKPEMDSIDSRIYPNVIKIIKT